MAGDHKTFQLRYVGPRFEGARLPLDVLSDLPAFRDLLVSYAKDEWRAINVGRQRLPRGFDKSISFDLVSIESGSAVPKLDWNRKTAQANLPGFTDELEKLVDNSYDKLSFDQWRRERSVPAGPLIRAYPGFEQARLRPSRRGAH
jgi:hypothetical protein